MDIIFIRELQIETYIGVWDWEQRQKQVILLDLELGWDIQQAAQSDDLSDTLNYEAVANTLTETIGSKSYQLVETIAEETAQILHEQFHVQWLRLRVSKPPAVANTRDVGVMIERRY